MSLIPSRPILWFAAVLAGLLLACAVTGCKKLPDGSAYALTSGGQILQFAVDDPGDITHSTALTGFPTDADGQVTEASVQLDYRPADQRLYAVTGAYHVYVIDPQSGQATLIGTGAPFSATSLADVQMDFDPVRDFMRVVSSDRNLRVSPNGDLLGSGNALAYASGDTNAGRTPALAGIAYDHAVAGAGSTTLYALDATTQSLVQIGSRGGSPESPDDGFVFTVGPLGVDFGGNAGFDIQGNNDVAYAALSIVGAGASLYTVDLHGGAASRVGVIGDGDQTIIALTVATDTTRGN